MKQGLYTGGDEPIVLGTAYRIRPQLLDRDSWLFRVSILPFHSLRVYDNGEEMTEHLSLNDDMPISLWQPTEIDIANRLYVTKLNGGLFRLASAPRGQILCDVEAPVEKAWTWGPNQSIADALQRYAAL